MSNTTQCQLKDVAEIQTGPFGSQLHMSDYVKNGTPIITVEHFGENKIIHDNIPLVSDFDKERLIKYTLKEGDVVFSRVGSVDRRVYVTASEEGWMFSGRCLRVRPLKNKVDGKYLSYYFGQESFKEYIRMVAVGATMPSINTQILSEAEVIIHSLPEQEAIAEVLSSLDDKIDLLHRQNKTLEQLAETLFRQWFVEDAEETTVGHEFNVTMGQSPPGESYNENGLGIVFYQGRTDFTFRLPIPRIYCTEPTRFAEKFDTLLSVRAPVGDINLANERCCIGRGVAAIRHKNSNLHYSYTYNTFKQLQNIFDIHEDTGTVFGAINKLDLLSVKCIKFDFEKIDLYNTQIGSIDDKIYFNCLQIKKLESLRDTLLPKLMNGILRVIK